MRYNYLYYLLTLFNILNVVTISSFAEQQLTKYNNHQRIFQLLILAETTYTVDAIGNMPICEKLSLPSYHAGTEPDFKRSIRIHRS